MAHCPKDRDYLTRANGVQISVDQNVVQAVDSMTRVVDGGQIPDTMECMDGSRSSPSVLWSPLTVFESVMATHCFGTPLPLDNKLSAVDFLW